MFSARCSFISTVAAITCTTALMFPQTIKAAAGSVQTCTVGDTCSVGEFLYDDSYTPITGATCNLTSYAPSGSVSINNAVMSAGSNGWYSHSFSTPSTTGYYPTQVCCTSGSDYLCIDKSYQVSETVTGGSGASASDIAAAVWAYSDRTMSSFGSLVSDVWTSSARTLTSVMSASDSANIAEIKKTTAQNRLLLEQIVNKPIVQNSIEEVPDLTSRIEDSKAIASSLNMNTLYASSKIGVLNLKWNQLSSADRQTGLAEVAKIVGSPNDSAATNTIFGQIAWFKSNWKWDETNQIADQALAVQQQLSVADIKSLSTYADTLANLVGESTDKPTGHSLYAKLNDVASIYSALGEKQSQVTSLLSGWSKLNPSVLAATVSSARKSVLAVNRIPGAANVLDTTIVKDAPQEKLLKNQLLGIDALIKSNKMLLARGGTGSFASTWLEEGSIVFKTLITNPSTLISQDVPLQYYLPQEVKKEDIIEMDPDVTVQYDAEKDQYYVQGQFTLAPGETKTVSVRVSDVWDVSVEQIESLRKQAETLGKPLEKTAYFAQSVTLASDINASLDKIVAQYNAAVTPEQKIRASREAKIDLAAVNDKLSKLQDLVTQSGSASNMLGFVGGAQAVGVWGIIIALAAGFVFIALYMRRLVSPASQIQPAVVPTVVHHRGFSKTLHVLVLVGVGIVSAGSGASIAWRLVSHPGLAQTQVLGTEAVAAVPVISTPTPLPMGGPQIIRVIVPEQGIVNVYRDSDAQSALVLKLATTREAIKMDVATGWVKIALDTDNKGELLQGWVKTETIEEAVVE